MYGGEGQGEFRELATDARCELDELLDEIELRCRFGVRWVEAGGVYRRPTGRQIDRLSLSVPAREEAPGQRAPRQYPHPQPFADRQHRRFDASRQQRVRR